MATGAQQTSDSQQTGTASNEPPVRRYALTPGQVIDLQRPGGLPGSTTGAEGDTGREGTVTLGVVLPPHTGF